MRGVPPHPAPEREASMRDMDLSALRERFQQLSGRDYWRSLEELAGTEAFEEFLHREFPDGASEWIDPVGRRQFLKLMGAALALAGVGACTRQPAESIVPYVRAPEEIVPGRPLFFATAMSLSGVATGLLIESHMGRPTKVEGNPEHPGSLGATDAFAQASVLTLYDPDRSQTPTYLEEIRPYAEFLISLDAAMTAQRALGGAGLRLLTETISSPTLAHQIQMFLADLPEARWHQYEPIGRSGAREGARLAFGEPVNTIYRFDQADVVLAFGDVLSCQAGNLRFAREFASRRRVFGEDARMSRVYAVESSPSITGSVADHRLPLRPSDLIGFAHLVAGQLGAAAGPPPANLAFAAEIHDTWIPALVRDLQAHGGSSLVVAGDEQPPVVHALAHAMNHALGNVGATLVYTDPIEAEPIDQLQSLRELVDDMNAGRVDLLVILGGNPVYTAPADLDFGEALRRVRLRVHHGLYRDETSELCHWHVPESHYLETWSDVRAFDGTVTVGQPLIAPLYGGRSAHEIVSALAGRPGESAHDLVREFWTEAFNGEGEWGPFTDVGGEPFADFDRFWRRILHDGFIVGTALPERTISLQENWAAGGASGETSAEPLQVIFRADPSVYDGRFANNPWLQELPKPLTKLTWENAVIVSPRTAEDRFGIRAARWSSQATPRVTLRFQGRTVEGPLFLLPGHAHDCATVFLGYGRRRVGRVGAGLGFDAYRLRTSDALWYGSGAEIQVTDSRTRLATTQGHHNMEGRDLVRAATLQEYLAHPDYIHQRAHTPPKTLTMYPAYTYDGHAWGMSVDLNACIGCNACVVACQAENNIPTVGKDQVLNHREMHWLRIDTYYAGHPDNPVAYHQPVMCMHCENAPCEVVCPVNATVHSFEGLNDQVYNRCVGTRYCSHNCPYKVRRFNFFLYADFTTPSLKAVRNPDVTVRSRGVMEKCTFCVQRINHARIDAKKEDRMIRDGEVLTACQAACPTQAIVFGDINDPESQVSRLKAEPRNFGLLDELNTRPRLTYLSALRNPNPEIVPIEGRDGPGPDRLWFSRADRLGAGK
jgi:MoCo/4Fe-4S cofactor protein with predicted Tat translocation signal